MIITINCTIPKPALAVAYILQSPTGFKGRCFAYFLDPERKTGFFCNSGELSYPQFFRVKECIGPKL